MATNKKQAILLSIMCLWFATAFIISCYHPAQELGLQETISAIADAQRYGGRYERPTTEWKFHWPHERRYHEDLSKLSLLVLPVFAICVPLWFIFRDSAPISPAASSHSPHPPDGQPPSTV